jgi:hypothetical protein
MNILLVTSLLLISLASSQDAHEKATALPLLDDEEYAVLNALMQNRYRGNVPPLVMFEIIPPDPARFDVDDPAMSQIPDLEAKTIESFVARNNVGGRLEDRFGLPRPVYLIAEETRETFSKEHPHVSFGGRYSRVGVNQNRTQAIVMFTSEYSGNIFELRKFNDQWKVTKRVLVWEF